MGVSHQELPAFLVGPNISKMDSLTGQQLIKADGSSHAAEAALDGKDLVLYYFSAHWCPPCRQFTPMLKDFYEEAEGIEIVFVSSDRSAEDMTSYMKGYLASPASSCARRTALSSQRMAVQESPACHQHRPCPLGRSKTWTDTRVFVK